MDYLISIEYYEQVWEGERATVDTKFLPETDLNEVLNWIKNRLVELPPSIIKITISDYSA